MPDWWPFNTKQPEPYVEVSGAVPVGFGQGYFQQPDHDYESYAKQGYARDELVYACIRELATAAGEPNYRVLRATDSEPVEVGTDSPLWRLIHYPNRQQDWNDFLEQLITHLYVSGNVYLFKTRNGSGRMVEMHLLRPDRISIKSDPKSGVQKYEYELNGSTYYIDENDISHLKFPNPTNDLYGLSPLSVLARTINLDLSQLQFAKAYFQNAGVPSGMLKVKRKIQNDEQAASIRQKWRSTFGGPTNFHQIAVLDEDATYEAIGASNLNEMAFPDLRDTTESRICMAFGVPPILIGSVVGLNRATYSNYREARQSFFTETMIPLANRITRFLNHCFEYEYPSIGYVSADFSEVAALTEDQNSLTERTVRQWETGLISLNEARSVLQLDPLEGGEVRRLPLNVYELSSEQVEISIPQIASTTPMELQTRAQTLKIEDQLEPDSPYKPLGGQPRERALNAELVAARIEEVDKLIPKIERYYTNLKNRMDGILGRFMEQEQQRSAGVVERKVYPFDSDVILPDGALDDLTGLLRNSYASMVRTTFRVMNANAGLGTLDYSEKLPVVRNVMTVANVHANMIHETTKRAVAKAVDKGLQNGYSIQQLANGVPDDGFRGLRAIVDSTYKNRARTIARTEMSRAQNQASLGYSSALGSEYSQAYDPDGDENDTFTDNNDPYGRTCAERHLEIYRNEDAIDIVDHPNGTLTWTPMPSTYKPEIRLGETVTDTKWVQKVDAPKFVQSNARKGLKYYEEGRAGSGLTSKTVREARALAGGHVSGDKLIRMSAWFARHKTDLDAPQNSSASNEDFPAAGAVAWYLWGGDPLNPSQAMDWAEREAERYRNEND
jgi:HK97 family phage portal protein